MSTNPESDSDDTLTDEERIRAVVRDELNEQGEEATGGRRDFLQALGLGGLAAGMGGGAGYAARSAVEPASAQSTGDGDGDIGTPSDPVDVFGDGISATSVSTDEVSRNIGHEPDYFIYDDAGTVKAADVNGIVQFSGSDAGAVIQSAYDDLIQGSVALAGQTFDMETSVTVNNQDVGLIGMGRATTLHPTSTFGDAYVVDMGPASTSTIGRHMTLDGIHIDGIDAPSGMTGAFRFTFMRNAELGPLYVSGMRNNSWALTVSSTRGPIFDCNIYPHVEDSDQGLRLIDPGGSNYTNRNTVYGGRIDGTDGGTTGTGFLVGDGATGETVNTNKFIAVNVESFDTNLEVRGVLNRFSNFHTEGAATTGINITSSADRTQFSQSHANDGVTDNGARSRWDGVIGGGLLGGIDLSAESGFYDGTPAMSDGSSGLTGDAAYSLWTWDNANSQWVRADGQATI